MDDKLTTIDKIVAVLMVLYILGFIAFWAGIIWIVIHFIRIWW